MMWHNTIYKNISAAQALTREAQDQALSSCPPCTAPVEKECFGGHVKEQQPCNQACSFSCGEECGALLSCGNHACSRICHAGSARGEKHIPSSTFTKEAASWCIHIPMLVCSHQVYSEWEDIAKALSKILVQIHNLHWRCNLGLDWQELS